MRVYKALSDERLRSTALPIRYRVCDSPGISAALPTLSHHLKILRDPGLSRRARWAVDLLHLNAEAFERYGICIDKLLTRCRQTAERQRSRGGTGHDMYTVKTEEERAECHGVPAATADRQSRRRLLSTRVEGNRPLPRPRANWRKVRTRPGACRRNRSSSTRRRIDSSIRLGDHLLRFMRQATGCTPGPCGGRCRTGSGLGSTRASPSRSSTMPVCVDSAPRCRPSFAPTSFRPTTDTPSRSSTRCPVALGCWPP